MDQVQMTLEHAEGKEQMGWQQDLVGSKSPKTKEFLQWQK